MSGRKAENIGEIPIFSVQFCREPQTTLKYKVSQCFKKSLQWRRLGTSILATLGTHGCEDTPHAPNTFHSCSRVPSALTFCSFPTFQKSICCRDFTEISPLFKTSLVLAAESTRFGITGTRLKSPPCHEIARCLGGSWCSPSLHFCPCEMRMMTISN